MDNSVNGELHAFRERERITMEIRQRHRISVRTWDIYTIRAQMVYNGKVLFDSTKPATDYASLRVN